MSLPCWMAASASCSFPFLSNKYDLTKHPLYRYTADYDKKYAFDIERFLSHRLKPRPDDAVEVYQADLSGEPVA